MTAEQMHETIYRGAKDFGIPVIILGVLLWFLRDGAIATHSTVVEPVVKAHIEFLRATQEALRSSAESQERQVEALQELSAGQRDLQRLMSRRQEGPPEG